MINKSLIKIDYSKDGNLTDFGRSTLYDRYLLPNEKTQDAFARVAAAYGSNVDHAQRLYDYMSNQWFVPATPVLSNGGAGRGLPISCFLNEMQDSLESIVDTWYENCWLSAKGGGIGTYYGNVRSIKEPVGMVGHTSGIIPFVKVQDSISLAISQGSQRRGSSAAYCPVWHPEIEEFIEIRRPTGGDPQRKSLNIHNAVVVDDKFMQAVENDWDYSLISPLTNKVKKTVKARELWIRLLKARLETGEPYILFIDNVNKQRPDILKTVGLSVKTSNLCAEITLPTGLDQHGKERTAVCCLSSLNLDKYDEWSSNEMFIKDMLEYLDNVLQDFIERAGDKYKRAVYAAIRERSIGLGTMGLHSYLQSKMIPFDSLMAKVYNKKIFQHIHSQAVKANKELAYERGSCPDATEAGIVSRFSHMIAIAPNASSSIICGAVSAGIEPIIANSFMHKTLSGSFVVRNKYLKELLQKYNKDTTEVWSSIRDNQGSVQHLEFLTELERDVFKTAFEVDQRWIIDLAADRQPYICQSQSLNLFLRPTIDKKSLHSLHLRAWKSGVKSLYYCRSQSIGRAEYISKNVEVPYGTKDNNQQEDECLACQG
jgi:ribonucleoside-diphosphate reductase alpha chain